MGPSGLVLWKKYLDYLNKYNTSGIRSLEMRYKKKSWMSYGTQVVYNDGGVYYKDKYHDPFCKLYHFAHLIQNSCYEECRFLNHTEADMRIGDAWGYTDGMSKQAIHDGLSIVTPQTVKGEEVLKQISEFVEGFDTSRKENIVLQVKDNSSLWNCIRNSEKNISDAESVYDSVGFLQKFYRKLSYLISVNDDIYILVKRVLKLFR